MPWLRIFRSMRLTARRRAILEELVKKPLLTSTDFYGLFSGQSSRGLRRVLTDFAALGYLKREALRIETDTWAQPFRWEYAYWLSPKGLDLARRAGLDPKQIGQGREARSLLTLPHDRAITDFHLALNAALGREVWWRQTGLKHAFRVGGTEHCVNPDALFYAGRYYHFLEIERSRQGEYRDGESGLLRKVRNYLAYADRERQPYKERWPEMAGFFVLVVVATKARADRLLSRLATIAPHRVFRVVDAHSIVAEPSGRVLRTACDFRTAAHSLMD